MTPSTVRYRSPDEDSGRWLDFEFRPGDLVISTRSKSGTTWMQMICALLVFRTPELPRPLSDLSPWLDWLGTPREAVYRQLELQAHRRFIKTHTPLDGLPLDDRATFLVVARHPLDMAVSLYHQGNNLNRERISELTGAPALEPVREDLTTWLRQWITWDGDPRQNLDSLPGVFAHLTDAWTRRHKRNIELAHYDDLLSDLPGEMKRLAGALGMDIDPNLIEDLAAAASFDAMKKRSELLAPDPAGGDGAKSFIVDKRNMRIAACVGSIELIQCFRCGGRPSCDHHRDCTQPSCEQRPAGPGPVELEWFS